MYVCSKLSVSSVQYQGELRELLVCFQLTALGRLRLLSADEIEKKTEHKVRAVGPNFLWLVDFPLFVPGDEPGTLSPAHHPFTHPHPEDAHMLFSDPLKVK